MPGAGNEHGRTQAREGARRGPRRGRASVRALGGEPGEGPRNRATAGGRRRKGRGRGGGSPDGEGPSGALARFPRNRVRGGLRAAVPRRPALPANRPPPFWIRSLRRLSPVPIPPPRVKPRETEKRAMPRPRTSLGFLHSPLHYRRRRLPAQEPGSRLGAHSALEGRGVANRSARPRPPRPPSYCQSHKGSRSRPRPAAGGGASASGHPHNAAAGLYWLPPNRADGARLCDWLRRLRGTQPLPPLRRRAREAARLP